MEVSRERQRVGGREGASCREGLREKEGAREGGMVGGWERIRGKKEDGEKKGRKGACSMLTEKS